MRSRKENLWKNRQGRLLNIPKEKEARLDRQKTKTLKQDDAYICICV